MSNFTDGIVKKNPVFILMLGLCPFLAVTTQFINGLGMGAATLFVLLGSNIVVSVIRKVVPENIRIPIFIVVIASFVTIVDLFMQAYAPSLAESLGIFIPLIVVNCIILGRAEAFASKNSVGASMLDGIGMAIGFTISLVLLATVRELLGNGTITMELMGVGTTVHVPILEEHKAIVMILPPGAFLALGIMMGFFNKIRKQKNPDANAYSLAATNMATRPLFHGKNRKRLFQAEKKAK